MLMKSALGAEPNAQPDGLHKPNVGAQMAVFKGRWWRAAVHPWGNPQERPRLR
jgi:hypothetical protein